ncbi:HNH endonuclease family protein [Aeromonas veronii]|uniref:hypothetical protein n=1 Tax=Aeromonas veronii TaxID=654 RepID=UPI002B4966D0|nr:hypothetical protein [Aeromonas veronii]
MNTGFEKIFPTPIVLAQTLVALNSYTWNSGANVVINFKGNLKVALRKAQCGRCCFCRRQLYDDYATHLEHFLDKESFNEYRFEVFNLALSCGTCNGKKNGTFSTWSKNNRRAVANFIGPTTPSRLSPFLNGPLSPNAQYPNQPAAFSWVHPHFHLYSEHISISRGWVFKYLTNEGKNTIDGVKLNDVGEIERRALAEKLENRGSRLSKLVCAMSELEFHRASDVGTALAKAIRRKRASIGQ